ncbi:hypothetical protein [Deinococcus sp. YIM 77859]|uniref:hypothetical protein n=1 Tax=Deinococcus sp. YIM 77859 TaxID=1540221 RepID=UPI0006925730|nr:hypothetical protein [Deinococcus sp. YIM 77859]
MSATASPWLPAARSRSWSPCLALTALLLLAGTLARAQSSPLKAQQVQGRAEVLQGGAWRPVSRAVPVAQGLRTGAGQVWLTSTREGQTGRILAGPDSRLRVFRGEADLQGGRFLLVGPVAAYVLGHHLVLERDSQARVDLMASGTPRRVAVLAGSGRLALGTRVLRLGAGQQVNLGSGAVSAYSEGDPWYAPQFTGVGSVTVEATRGPVYLARGGTRQIAKVGSLLQLGERLQTGEGAWAEVGLAGGGYLRLQAGSELSVVGSTRTPRGQEVTLQLTRGNAWNVVRGSGSGTPLVGSALRGSTFLLGVNGVTKTFGPSTVPAPPSSAGAGGLNRPLDAELEQPLTLQLAAPPRLTRTLTLSVTSLPNARVTAQVGTRTFPLSPVTGAAGQFRLSPTSLAEGRHTVVVRAEWRGQVRTRTLRVVIDRTPPTLGNLRAERSGNVLLVGGTARDEGTAAAGSRLTVTVELGPERFRRTVRPNGEAGDFQLTLPAPTPGTPVRLTVSDEAGNEAHAVLP